jgi:uncharacterized repeat protein (TIGR01451 family)
VKDLQNAAALAVIGALALVPSIASARPAVSLQLSGAYVTHDAAGDHTAPLASRAAKPGDLIRWDIAASNRGDAPARHVVAAGRVPQGTAFVAGSTHGSARVEYSIDGGKTWSTAPMVVVKTATGVERKPADPSTFTGLRFVEADALRAGSVTHFTYEVWVK